MALTHSTGLKNYALGSGIKSAFDGGTGRLVFYTGSAPASADTAPTGTVVDTLTLPSTAFAAASGGAIALSGVPLSASAAATATIGYWRMQLAGDLGTTNTTDRRLQGTATATGGGGDITFDNLSATSGSPVNLNSFTYNHAP